MRSHSSPAQPGAKSVASGITPMNHAHCDALPRMRTWKRIRYGRTLSASRLGALLGPPPSDQSRLPKSAVREPRIGRKVLLLRLSGRGRVTAHVSRHARRPVCALPSLWGGLAGGLGVQAVSGCSSSSCRPGCVAQMKPWTHRRTL